jgi:hypothetical protein
VHVRRYDAVTDYFLIKDWMSIRGLTAPAIEDVAEIGFVCFHDTTPVAAAFLRKMEGDWALFDGLVSNPTQTASIRDEALDCVMTAIMKLADETGIKGMLAYTADNFTLLRAEKFGLTRLPHVLLQRDPPK